MSALVIDFTAASRSARVQARMPTPSAAGAGRRLPAQDSADTASFQFWTGASGRPYVHTIHGLIECPEVPDACYILVKRLPSGVRKVLHVGQLEHHYASLNLAEIRHKGATLGASEVHLHFLAEDAAQRSEIVQDISAALSGENAGVASGRSAAH